MTYISTIGLLKQGWETVKAHFTKIVGATAALFIIQTLLDKVTQFYEKAPMSPEAGLVMILATLTSLFLGVAVTSAVIRVVRGAKVNTNVFTITPSQVLRYVGVVVVIMLITIITTIPVIISFMSLIRSTGLSIEAYAASLATTSNFAFGDLSSEIKIFLFTFFLAVIVWAYINIRLMFATYFVVDGKTGVFESIKGSWRITKGNIWTMIKLMTLSVILGFAGFLALLVGLLVVVPVIAFAYAHLYVYLADQKRTPKVASEKAANE